MVAAHRTAYSGRRATMTRFMTLVRAAMRRPGLPSTSVVRSSLAQIRLISASISGMLWARPDQRITGGAIGVTSVVIGSLEPPPTPAVAGEKIVGGRRAPSPSLVVGERRRRRLGPRLDDRVDDAPCLLDLVGTGEQR